jgi:hypothetical protein
VRFLFENQRLDAERRELVCVGESVPIKPQVFDVLLYLLEHRDRVVGKNELFDNVWDGRIVSDQLWRRPRNIAPRDRSRVVKAEMLTNCLHTGTQSLDCCALRGGVWRRSVASPKRNQHPIRAANSPKSLATISQSPLASRSYFCNGPYSVGRATKAVFSPSFWAAFKS